MSRRTIHRGQVRLGWSIDTDALAAESTPMHRTIPALLCLVPAQDTFHMRTHRAELVRLSLSVLVNGHWLRCDTIMEHTAAVGPEIFDILDVGL